MIRLDPLLRPIRETSSPEIQHSGFFLLDKNENIKNTFLNVTPKLQFHNQLGWEVREEERTP